MTGLEIIKNQITILKSQLDIPGICIGCIEKQLEDLRKVEVDLEAWEVVKDKISITEYYDNEQDYEEDINSHNALCLNSNLKIQNSNNEDEWFIPLENEESNKLKKAMEVR